jgi:hypothetical protein
MMNLYDPRTYRYVGRGKSVPLILIGQNTPLVDAKILLAGRGPVKAKLEVDTGGDNAVLVNSPFVKRHKLVEAMQNTTQDSRNGAGGNQQVITGRANAVRLGSFTLKNVPVQLSLDTEGAGASEENDGLIGGEIFRRFKVTLDYSRKRMILEPNKSFNDPYNVGADANNKVRDNQVKSIFPKPRRIKSLGRERGSVSFKQLSDGERLLCAPPRQIQTLLPITMKSLLALALSALAHSGHSFNLG